jgi:hypothetical protein
MFSLLRRRRVITKGLPNFFWIVTLRKGYFYPSESIDSQRTKSEGNPRKESTPHAEILTFVCEL